MTDVDKAQNYEFDASISAEEREFYLKAYPTPDNVRDRRTHCTTCKMHLGTAPVNAENIKMHPILRVTHCPKCQDFYNCGEFSKGEDGSELYCRWCGQGGEVYCCSSCPFVFCKSCITKNLSRGVVADIEQNENWRCFACAPKILWPLRAVHWALMNFIEKQKKEIEAMNLSEEEKLQELAKDRSNCCRLAKAKCGNMSDSMDSIDSALSKRSQSSSSAAKKKLTTPSPHTPAPKRPKTSNSEVVCTPDLMSMLEPDCQLTLTSKSKQQQQQSRPLITPKVVQVQSNYTPPQARSLAPPPLIQLRSPNVQLRAMSSPSNAPVIRRTVVSPRTPSPAGSQSPVYHTINGYRIDLNSAAQQGTYRLPNGKLIQVKRQSAPVPNTVSSPANNTSWQHRTPVQSPIQRLQISPAVTQPRSFVTVQQHSTPAPPLRYPSGVVGNTVISSLNQNGPQIQMVNGGVNVVPAATQPAVNQSVQIRPVMVRHVFPNNAYGVARSQFQDQIFNAMEICQHLTGKIQSLTNSNAYKTAKNYLELKELYIHMSYLLTYAIGRFKGLQDKCLGDMRQLGFGNDADSLENGQLAAGVDYVRYGQLEDVDLFTANMNSFHNQIYEYRKSLLANMEHLEDRPPLSPLHDLKGLNDIDENDDELVEIGRTSNAQQSQRKTSDWHSTKNYEDEDDDLQEVTMGGDESTSYPNDDGADFDDTIENEYYGGSGGGGGYGAQRSTEDVMRREEESHAYDRKLTRLIQQYPSIWCSRHPDYGNFEVTRKQWRTIASHFTYSGDMKMRWKNIRKRYVRIERRMHEGKRFNGYFDKATNFLINRDKPMNEWIQVDCGADDGDNYERQKLDQIEKELHGGDAAAGNRHKEIEEFDEPLDSLDSNRPIEIKPLDMKIIHFVKCNPVLWRKSSDSQFHKMDEQTRKSLWMHLWKSVPYVRCSDLVDRWTQLYEMYKTFRLKTIKSERALAALELKYSKYLAKLYFLYKIDEEELINEDKAIIYGDPFDDDDTEDEENTTSKVLDKPDDKEFLLALVRAVRHYSAIWDENNSDFHDLLLREESWQEISGILEKYGHKQASDNEDDEIEIVEPKTDTINLDSDDETTPTSNTPKPTTLTIKQQLQKINIPSKITPIKVSEPDPMLVPMGSNQEDDALSTAEDMNDFMSAAHSLLASMLEVDIIEGDTEIHPGGNETPKKQPRKKTTNKPNPTLLKQKRLAERQKMEELKRNDTKLKMQCLVNVQRVDAEYPDFKEKLEDLENRRREWREEQAKKAKEAEERRINETTNENDLMEAEAMEGAETKENIEYKDAEEEKIDTSSKFMGVLGLTETVVESDEPKNKTVAEVAIESDKVEESKSSDAMETDDAAGATEEKTEAAIESNKVEESKSADVMETDDAADATEEKTETAIESNKMEESKSADVMETEDAKIETENETTNTQKEAVAEKIELRENAVAENIAEYGEKTSEQKNEEQMEKNDEATSAQKDTTKGRLEATKEEAANLENIDDELKENKSDIHSEKTENGVTVESVGISSESREQEAVEDEENVTETKADDINNTIALSLGTDQKEKENENKTTDLETTNKIDSGDILKENMQEICEENISCAEETVKEAELEETIQRDEVDNAIEQSNEAQNETEIVSNVTEQLLNQNQTDNENLEDIEKVLASNIENNESTKIELPELIETSETNAIKPPTPEHILKEDKAIVDACLEIQNTDDVATTTAATTAVAIDSADNTDINAFKDDAEKMDIDTIPLDLPISKSNELQLDAADKTAQTENNEDNDVEMATLPIESEIESNNE